MTARAPYSPGITFTGILFRISAKMGRWARFSCTKRSTGEDFTHEYKFWFGTQDSNIPWVENYHRKEVRDYDEDAADDAELTEEQRAIWEERQNTEFFEDEETDERLAFLDDFCDNDNTADDTDADLPRYWKEVGELAAELGVEPLVVPEGAEAIPLLEKWEQWEGEQGPLAAAHDRIYKLDKEVREQLLPKLADLHLKTTICALLTDCGSYSCYYED